MLDFNKAMSRLKDRVEGWERSLFGVGNTDEFPIEERIRHRYERTRKLNPSIRRTPSMMRECGVLDDWKDVWDRSA